jgi:hypothetical protein
MRRTDLPRQELPHAPRHPDGRPRGTRCTDQCRRPASRGVHCGVCHATMRSVTDFDNHRSDGWCLDLAAIGLINVDGLWATREGHRQRAEDSARLARVRSQRLPGDADALAAPDGADGHGDG